jgi:hypothetical protein
MFAPRAKFFFAFLRFSEEDLVNVGSDCILMAGEESWKARQACLDCVSQDLQDECWVRHQTRASLASQTTVS